MGADYEGQEKGIEELKKLSPEAREYLCHHLRNALSVVGGNAYLIEHMIDQFPAIDLDKIKSFAQAIEKASEHILDDLKKIGC